MKQYKELSIQTSGERFYPITDLIQKELKDSKITHGMLTLFCPHTSCALCVNEDYDPSAREDMQEFLKHLAPRNLKLITHTDEGPDDSPSHLKSILLQPSLHFIIDQGSLVMGQWQGIFLAEFRDAPKNRKIYFKSFEC